jgi:hypothetical protein
MSVSIYETGQQQLITSIYSRSYYVQLGRDRRNAPIDKLNINCFVPLLNWNQGALNGEIHKPNPFYNEKPFIKERFLR